MKKINKSPKKVPQKLFDKFVKLFPRLCVDILIVNKKGEYLLGKRNNQPAKGKYFPMGGTVMLGECPIDTACRVLEEELGSDIKIGKFEFIGVSNNYFENLHRHDFAIVYTAKYKSGEIELDGQHSKYEWSSKLPIYYRKLIK